LTLFSRDKYKEVTEPSASSLTLTVLMEESERTTEKAVRPTEVLHHEL
jgi:hypothetical protein